MPRWQIADLARSLSVDTHVVEEGVIELASEDLVVPSNDRPGWSRAVEPELALPVMASRRLARDCPTEVSPNVGAVERFIDLHRHSVRPTRVDEFGSLDAAAAMIECVVSIARAEVTIVTNAIAPRSWEISRTLADRVTNRSGCLRVLWSDRTLRAEAAREHCTWLSKTGCPSRVSTDVLPSAVLVDREIAVIVADTGRPELIRDTGRVNRLTDLTDFAWGKTMDRSKSQLCLNEISIDARRGRVLHLLAEGQTDEAIARKLGVSVRTIRSDVSIMLQKLNAKSRFQAGVQAMRMGLL
jgi:hypothetical protein